MSFDPAERETLAALANVLIPAADGFPSASQAAVAHGGLDEVLSFRPDFTNGLKVILEQARGADPGKFLEELRQRDPAAYGLLTELIPGAYFLDDAVRTRLGYRGQVPRPIDEHPDYLDDGLLQSVIDRGPIYRPTPPSAFNPQPTPASALRNQI